MNDETMQRLRDDLDAMSFKYFPGSRKGRQSSARFHLPELVKYVAAEIERAEVAARIEEVHAAIIVVADKDAGRSFMVNDLHKREQFLKASLQPKTGGDDAKG